jgi:hypothetical protein
MRRNARLAVALLLVGPTSGHAADLPNLVGSWKVETPVVFTGNGAHHPTDAPQTGGSGQPHLRDFTGTFTVVGQEGDRFWGTLETPYYKEDLIGVLTGEEGRFLMVDSDGFHQGRVLGPGEIRYCYQQNSPELRVAGCGKMTKQP